MLLIILFVVPVSGQVAVVKVVPLQGDGSWIRVAYDLGKNEVFVGSQVTSSECLIQVISDANNSIVANVTLTFNEVNRGFSGEELAYDSGKGEIFVAIMAANTVFVISDSNNSVVATINVGNLFYGIAYDKAKNEIFVTSWGPNATSTVSVISDTTNTVIDTIPLSGPSSSIVCDSAKGEMFVTGGGEVAVISDETNSVVATIPTNAPSNEQCFAYDPSKGEIYVSFDYWPSVSYPLGESFVSIINDATNAVFDSPSLPCVNYIEGIAYTDNINGMAYDSNTGEILIGSMKDSHYGVGTNCLFIMSDSGNFSVQTIPLPASPAQIAYDSGKGEIFISTDQNSVIILTDSTMGIPPVISNMSVTNQTYLQNSLMLNFTVDKAVSWTGYSLDGGQNVTISANATIANLNAGQHSLTVYANDTLGNMGSQTVNFTVKKVPTTMTGHANTIALIAIPATAACLIAGLLLLRRRRRTSQLKC